MYLYFDSKELLLSGLGNRYTEELLRRSNELLEGDGPRTFIERFEGFLEEVVDLHFAERELHHALFHGEAVGEAGAMRELRESMRRDASSRGASQRGSSR